MNNKQIPAEVYSRVSGYFRPVFTNGKTGQWNPGKTEEFKERVFAHVNPGSNLSHPTLSL